MNYTVKTIDADGKEDLNIDFKDNEIAALRLVICHTTVEDLYHWEESCLPLQVTITATGNHINKKLIFIKDES